jgi:hypothetical protein
MPRDAASPPARSSVPSALSAGRVDRSEPLSQLIADYADNLREQAAVLLGLTGHLQVENQAEAGAYLAVAEDLTRILAGELTATGFASA